MKRSYATSMALLFSTAAPCFLALSLPAMARDDIPESLRLEQDAEKAYAKKPVVPIERGNAHHRNLGDPGDDSLPADAVPDPGTSGTAQPSAAAPAASGGPAK